MPYADENRLQVGVNKDTQANQAIIAAPGSGKKIAIDLIFLNPSGGANAIILTGASVVPFVRNDNQDFVLANSFHNPTGCFLMNDNQAFSMALSAATAVEGIIIYRILNN